KQFEKSFTKNFYNFSMLSSMTFQTVPDPRSGGVAHVPDQRMSPFDYRNKVREFMVFDRLFLKDICLYRAFQKITPPRKYLPSSLEIQAQQHTGAFPPV
ncbi:hypothetical protein, partial [Novacetimonas hansenii]|uniref:hypothetical protein n=1 Tax=Novacetimonas hansenii TaxID=436 RepID=UPI0039E983BB